MLVRIDRENEFGKKLSGRHLAERITTARHDYIDVSHGLYSFPIAILLSN